MLHFSSSLVILVASALLAAVCQCLYLLCRGTQNWRPRSRYSLASEGGSSPPLSYWLCPCKRSPACGWLQMQPSVQLAALAARDIAPSCSDCCPPGCRLLFLQSCFLSCRPPACTGTWAYSIPAAEILGVLVLIPVTLYPLLWTTEELLLEVLIRRGEKPSSALCVIVEDLLIFKSEHLSAVLSAYYLLFPDTLAVSFYPHKCL